MIEIRQALVPPAAEAKTDADGLRAEFEEHRQQVLTESEVEQADRAAGVHEVLESLNARRNEAIPPPLPMDSVEAALPEWEAPETPAPPVMVEPKEPFSLERFMGVKLFAWLGGVAMFFGVVFFVKYAFEKNLIPPAVRIAMGFATGTGMLVGGLSAACGRTGCRATGCWRRRSARPGCSSSTA